jgi:CheY-like chemotaxis protein/RNA polymerase subunit RPABC4/transcription elongation factor Spt4
MHIDAFFEYLMNRTHVYWCEVPSIDETTGEAIRDGVPAEEDLALQALLLQRPPDYDPGFNDKIPPISPDQVMKHAELFFRECLAVPGQQRSSLSLEKSQHLIETEYGEPQAARAACQLVDREHRGGLRYDEFVVAMHLVSSLRKFGTFNKLPASIPSEVFEAAKLTSSQLEWLRLNKIEPSEDKTPEGPISPLLNTPAGVKEDVKQIPGLIRLGLFLDWEGIFRCNYQYPEAKCQSSFSDSEELHTHFEKEHFAYTRTDSAYCYICSSCQNIREYFTEICAVCGSTEPYKLWICGIQISDSENRGESTTSDVTTNEPGHLTLHQPKNIPFEERTQGFDVSPSSSDDEDDRVKALLRVQRRRQASHRISNVALTNEPIFRPLDILICEDHPVSRMVLEELLEQLRCRTISASNGPEALGYAMSEVKFDLILMEIKLPQILGTDVARMIRDTKNVNSQTPMAAVTAYLKELPSAHHFDAVLEKPPTSTKLTEVMCRLCQWEAPTPASQVSLQKSEKDRKESGGGHLTRSSTQLSTPRILPRNLPIYLTHTLPHNDA